MRDIADLKATRPGTNLVAEFDRVFCKDHEIPVQRIESAEGATFADADVRLKLLMAADRMMMMKVYFTKGSVIPVHRHDDHSTIVCLQQGRLKVNIGGETFIANPGDVWQHPRGVPHNHEALEDSYVLEIKAPAVKTW